ncbi:hypothetical protein N3K66_000809 [Trichothecium roseum]|uniref:Uncharacterized protein n=1 Tax=Trichothecium roseum TaxID=47278 RepID=A0ACC0VEZ9_9HYPO|nr:hypothetical protein N3K66_000809 [Trichothecium roseum]
MDVSPARKSKKDDDEGKARADTKPTRFEGAEDAVPLSSSSPTTGYRAGAGGSLRMPKKRRKEAVTVKDSIAESSEAGPSQKSPEKAAHSLSDMEAIVGYYQEMMAEGRLFPSRELVDMAASGELIPFSAAEKQEWASHFKRRAGFREETGTKPITNAMSEAMENTEKEASAEET